MGDDGVEGANRLTRRGLLKAIGGGAVLGLGVMTEGPGRESSSESLSTPEPPPQSGETGELPDIVPRIVGHRGAAGLAPPNTLPSIRRALELDVDGVELDVRRTQEGTLITFHDPVLDRRTSGTGLVAHVEYADLENVRVNGKAPIPTLAQALAVLADEDVSVVLELKVPGIAREVLSLVSDYGLVDRTTLVSFDVPYLMPAQSTPVQRGLLGKLPLTGVTDRAIRHEYEFVIPHYAPGQMREFTAYTWGTGVRPGIWSLVTTEQGIRDSLQARPAFLMTDRPDIAREQRAALFDTDTARDVGGIALGKQKTRD